MSQLSANVRVSRLRPAVDADVVDPLVHELKHVPGAIVHADSRDKIGPESGFLDVAVQIALDYHGWGLALIWVSKKLADPSLDELGNRIRDRLFRINQQPEIGKLPQSGYLPLVIGFGVGDALDSYDAPVRYVFLRAADREDFQLMLDSMAEHVRELPAELFEGQRAPTEYSFFWDEKLQRWRGCVWAGPPAGTWGDCWLPPIFDPNGHY